MIRVFQATGFRWKNAKAIPFFVIFSKAVEPDRLFDGLPNSLRPSSDGDGGGKPHGGHHNDDAETAAYTLPILIPLRVLPLLHDLAQQMVQAGHQQQLLQIYR